MSKLSDLQVQAFIYAENITNKATRDILKIYQSSLKNIRADIMALNEKVTWTRWELSKYSRLEKLEKQIFDNLKKISTSVYKVIKSNNKNIVVNTYDKSVTGYKEEAKSNINFAKIDPTAIKAIVGDPFPGVTLKDLIQDKYRKYAAKIKITIGTGLVQGLSAAQMSKALKDDLGISYKDAERIVRTEALRAESKAALEATAEAESKGIKLTKVWGKNLKTKGEDRENHIAMIGEKADKNGIFTMRYGKNIGAKAPAPRMFGIPEEDINCGCYYTEEVIE